MGRAHNRKVVVGFASLALIAASLWSVPTATASEDPTADPSTSESTGPEPGESTSEPTATPSPSSDLSSTPSPTPSPSSPSDDEDDAHEEPEESPSGSASPSPTDSPSSSEASSADEEEVDDYIVVVRNGAYIDSIKGKAEELGGQSDKELRGAVDGFTATLTDEDVKELEGDPNVKYVERDGFVKVDGAVSGFVDCNASSMGARDDGAVGPINLGFTVDWFGTSYGSIYINNNGGFVFNDGGGDFTAYRGVDLQTATRPYVLPLFTDIDTRYTDGVVTYGPLDNTDPSAGFCINWIDVGEYGGFEEDYSFQVILTNLGGGDIDLEFNYDRVSVPTNVVNNTFEVGYTAGDKTNYQILADSTDPAATVAGNLVSQKFPASCTVAGRYIYEIRSSGNPTPAPTPTPEPTTPDPTPSPTQSPATWGLDRIDQVSLPLNSTYVTPTVNTASDNYGQGVVAYVVDTGVRYTHQEFGNRARKNEAVKGIDEVSNDSDPNDCNGHGTHVAGTIGGYTYGVAKQVEIVGVRVLGCDGGGWTSDVIAGLNAIPSFHATHYPGYRAVVNMSLGGGKSVSMNAAVAALTAANIPVVVAAGNDDADAGNYSPASETTAITVGASTSSDVRSYFSNYGPVVDIFAPGSAITAAWVSSDSSIYTISGTSMASPHVAGAVALYLGLNSVNSSSPTSSQVEEAIVGYAESDQLNLDNPGTTTANKLLNVTNYTVPFTYITSLTSRSAQLQPAIDTQPRAARVPRQLIEARCTSRDSGGNPAPPPSAPPPSSGGGGGSGGGGSSDDGSKSGGGGGLNEVTTIVPSAAGAPGSNIALAGWGMETTREVLFNDVSAQFTVVSGGQVDVVVPDVPPGVYVVHAVLAPSVGRASFWEGFTVLARSGSASAPAAGSTPVAGKPPQSVAGTVPAAEFVSFTGKKTKMTRATRSKLAGIARDFTRDNDEAVIVAFTDSRETKASVRRAVKRAANMRRYLVRSGFPGEVTVRTEPGDTKIQRRGAMVYVEPEGAAEKKAPEGVTSVIVRMKKGRSPVVDGEVRGSDNVRSSFGESLSVGRYLGLRMYRIDLSSPVSEAVASQIAEDLTRDPGIAFAEPDSIVSTQVSVSS